MLPVIRRAAIAIVVGAVVTASASAAVPSRQPNGLLELRGGIRGQTKIGRSTCTAGPGNSIAIALNGVGGWSSLYLSASLPRTGKKGLAKVSLQGTGDRGNGYAIAVWNWTKQASARTEKQVRITGNGSAGLIDVTVPLASVADSPTLPDVLVSLRWTSGMCG